MHEVQHAAALRHARCATEIFQVEKIEAHCAIPLLDHDVGFLQVTRVDAGVVHAAQFSGERVRDGLAARIAVARLTFASYREVTQDLRALERFADEITGAHCAGLYRIHRGQRRRAMKTCVAQNIRAAQRSQCWRTGDHFIDAREPRTHFRPLDECRTAVRARKESRAGFSFGLDPAKYRRGHKLIGLSDQSRISW